MRVNSNISINEFTDVFVGIDIQILQLHQCSSDDFLGLNADFKKYYHQTKSISENAKQIFQALAQDETRNLLRDLENLYKDLKNIQIQFSGHLKSSLLYLKEIVQHLDTIFLPIKNLNQDLLTLKFLLANLRISNTAFINSEIENFEKILKEYNQVINDFKIFSIENEDNIESLSSLVSDSLRQFEIIAEKNIHDLDIILNNIHFGIILFAEKHQEVSLQIPDLTSKTDSSSQSIAEIITNLQYHDIIRQKMEHVQAAHNNLLDDLVKCAIDAEQNNEEKTKKLYSRIRDMANLQSAQLVFANKEYQKAIENITDKFVAISNDMSTIASMCHNINVSQDNSEELYLQNLLDKLNDSSSVLSRFFNASQSFANHIDILTTQISKTSSCINKFSSSIQNLKQITSDTISLFPSNQSVDDELIKSLQQVESLYKDIEKFEGVIRCVFTKIELIGSKLLPDIGDNLRVAQGSGVFSNAAQSMNDIIHDLNQKNINIKTMLDETLITSKTISSNVRESISKIRYYDFFEKVIVDIITEFNHIYQLLRADDCEEGSSSDGLNDVKRLYTMASEHKIHEAVTQGDVDLFSGEDEQNPDDDNLELF
jgi:ABC-type transporter Mla subunit MlaD